MYDIGMTSACIRYLRGRLDVRWAGCWAGLCSASLWGQGWDGRTGSQWWALSSSGKENRKKNLK